MSVFTQSLEGIGMKSATNGSLKPSSPNNPDRIFLNPINRITHKADYPILQVIPTTVEVHNVASDRAESKSVNGQVTTFQVILYGANQGNFCPARLPISIGPEGGNLDTLYNHHTKRLPHEVYPQVRKQVDDFLWAGGGHDIFIVSILTQKGIPYGTADHENLVAFAAQTVDNEVDSH
jgi:hypothetical protein